MLRSRHFFFFNDTATTEIYTLSLHDALPISHARWPRGSTRARAARGSARPARPGRRACRAAVPRPAPRARGAGKTAPAARVPAPAATSPSSRTRLRRRGGSGAGGRDTGRPRRASRARARTAPHGRLRGRGYGSPGIGIATSRGPRRAARRGPAAGRDVWVLGSIGPLGKYLEPLSTVTADEAREAFREQAEALLEGGVDAFVVETFSDLAEIALAVGAIRAITDLPVIAQMAFTD